MLMLAKNSPQSSASLWSRVLSSGAFLLIALFALTSQAQTYTGGGIGGLVTDPKGLAIPGVQIEATELATNQVYRATTTTDGEYLIPRVKPGAYKVTFAAPGFKQEIENQVVVQLDLTFRIDKKMVLGATTDSIQVNASEISINYDTPEISATLGAEQVEELPIIGQSQRGRSVYLLAVLTPGTSSTKNSENNVNNFSLGGGRPVTNEILIDGLPSTNPSDNTYTFTPSPESIEELKITTTPFTAEIGHTGGGVILANTRHGGNDFHAALYSFFNNRLMNARNYFQTSGNSRYDQIDPGFTLNGPVVIPHLYNGHDRTFFFTDLNITNANLPKSNSGRVPTTDEAAGNFSADAADFTIYDPATTVATVDADNNLIITRTPFENNTIPSSRIDSVAKQIVTYFPGATGSYGGGNNYQVYRTQGNQTLQGMIRFDHTISEKDSIFTRYGRYSPNTDAVNYIPNAANTDNTNGWYDNQFIISETHLFNAHISNDFRFGFVQEVNYTDPGGHMPSSLGLNNVPAEEFPNISTSNFISLGAGGPFHDRDRSYILMNNLLWQHGRHTFKLGGDWRYQMYKFWNMNSNVDSGNYNFDNTFTQIAYNDPTNGYTTSGGFDLADLLLGYPTQTVIQSDLYTYRLLNVSWALYAQDDWKISPKFTINLGLRWEFDGPTTEANNQFYSFDPNKVNSQTGNLGDAIFAGYQGQPRHFQPNIYHDFLPRIGFAWSPIKNTVFRGGFGAYRLPSIGYAYIGPLSKYQKYATLQSADGYTPAFQLQNGVPSVPYYVDANGNPEVPASLSNPTSSPVWIDNRNRTPYNLVWQFGIERQFGSWFAEADYVYNHGIKLPVQYTANQLTQSNLTAANYQSLRPFPQYADVQYFTNAGGANYNALELQLQHKWKNGFVISANYTFSKQIDDVDANDRVNGAPVQNVYDLHAERGISSSDIPQRFVIDWVYKLPIGRGGKYFNKTPILRDIIGGWQFAGVKQTQIGQPVKIYQSNNNNTTAAQRPDLTGNPNLGHAQRSINEWFNVNAFTPVSAGVFGSAPRFPVHGPGLNHTDLSVKRTFEFGQRYMLDFRADFQNAFNHPEFNNPDGNLGDVGSLNSDFGYIHGAGQQRLGQLSAKLRF